MKKKLYMLRDLNYRKLISHALKLCILHIHKYKNRGRRCMIVKCTHTAF